MDEPLQKHKIIETPADIDAGLKSLEESCATMARIIPHVHHVPLRRTKPGFASLASIIVSQQVSKQSADAIFGRFEEQIQPLDARTYLQAGEEAWIAIGLSRPKQRTFQALCTAILDKELDLPSLSDLPADQAISELVKVKGIGPWTAEVYMLFAVGHADIFPAGDLALQIAAGEAFGEPEKLSDKELRLRAESWRPWRGVAARLLWAYYAELKGRSAMP